MTCSYLKVYVLLLQEREGNRKGKSMASHVAVYERLGGVKL